MWIKLFDGFFQQDEWFGYGWYILHQDSLGYVFAPSVGHFNPLNLLVNHFLFSLWGMNYHAFLIISLLLNLVVVVLVYVLAKQLFQNTRLAVAAAIVFVSFASHYQATAWVIANIGTHFSVIFALVSTILFLRGKLLLSLTALLVSLLFKEVAIGLLLFYVAYCLFLDKKSKSNFSKIKIIVIFGALYVLFRISMLLLPNTTGDSLVTESQGIVRLTYNFATIPVKAVSQSIIPIQVVLGFSRFIAGLLPQAITGEKGSPAFDTFVLKRVFELIALVLSIGLAIWIFVKAKEKRIVVFGVFWIVINSFIFAFAPEQSGLISTIDSRNLYFVSIGAAISLVAAVDGIFANNRGKGVFFLLVILIVNLYFLDINLASFTERGRVRRHILQKILYTYPDLPERAVFYVKSDQSYYGLPEDEKILPFQSGLGQTLLGWYYTREHFPREFFEDRFLWEIRSQGYKQVDGVGFGYFREYGALKRAVDEYQLPRDSVMGFEWSGKLNLLFDVAGETRESI